MLKRFKSTSRNQSGFTIVELMIATMVFSVILLVVTYGVLHFTNDYYKGINSSTTQNTARNVIDSVAQAIQFSGGPVQATTTPNGYVCAGNQEFVYALGGQLPTAAYALSQITNTTCDTSPSPTGTELLQPHMRLTQLKVAPVTGDTTGTQWTISAGVAYGDNDQLCAPTSQLGSCAAGAGTLSNAQLIAPDVTCKSTAGSQFCNVAKLSTTVVRRLAN